LRDNPVSNEGIVFDETDLENRFVDILQKIGYNESQIRGFEERGDFFHDKLGNGFESTRTGAKGTEWNHSRGLGESAKADRGNAEGRRRIQGSVESSGAPSQSGIHTETQVLKNTKYSISSETEVDDGAKTTLSVDNVLVFVTGTKNNPQIKKVIRFDVETETEMETIREDLYERGSFSYSHYSFFKQEEFVREYRKKVLSLITNTRLKYGVDAAEEIATRLIEIVDSCETEEELLDKLHQLKKEL